MVPVPDATQPVCITPKAMAHLDGSLPATRRQFRSGGPITIVALGSSSTFGHGSTKVIYTYPSRLAVELLQRWPKHKINVINKGVSGEDVDEELLRLERDVFADKPQLVIWQIGTNAVMRNVDLGEFEKKVQQGITRIRATGADLLLMDLQFAPKVADAKEHQKMLELFDAIGKRNKIPVFHRFAIMHHWADSMQDRYVKDMVYSDGLHMTDQSYGCIATALADAIFYAVQPERDDARKAVGKR
ncbi:hypothetical protein BH09PSE6_BH09PSE6_29860 [soil metagenome]